MATQLLPEAPPLAPAPLVGLARTRLGYVVQVVTLALVFALSQRLTAPFEHSHAPISVSVGICVAALMLLGLRVWPAIPMAVLLGTVPDGHIAAQVVLAAGYSLTIALPVLALRRLGWNDPGFERLRDVIRYIAVALVAPIPLVICRMTSLAMVSDTPVWAATLLTIYLAELMGILLIGPLLLTWIGARPVYRPSAGTLELAALFAAIAAAALLSGRVNVYLILPTFPLLCWAGLRAGPRATTVATVALFVITASYTRELGVLGAGAVDRLIFVAGLNLTQSVTVLLLVASVAERHRSHALERQVDAAYRTLVAAAPFGVIGINGAGEVTVWSKAAEEIFGWAPAEVMGRRLPTIPAHREEEFAHMLAQGSTLNAHETIRRRKDGSELDISLTAWSLRDASGRLIGAMGVHQDITERKRAAEAVRRSEERFRVVATTTNDVVYEWDIVGDTDWWSDNLHQILGYDPSEVQEGKPHSWDKLLHPEDQARVTHALAELIEQRAEVWRCEYRLRRRDGTWAYVFDRARVLLDREGRPVRMLGAMMDITERREAEEALRRSADQLRQATKMEAIGRLAGGVAHDFNNLLTSVLGHAGLAIDAVEPQSPVHDDLLEIQAAGIRAAALTQQLLAFSRKQVLEPRLVDLNTVVGGIARMLRRTIGEDIELATRLAPDLGTVRADPVQMEQVLLNLAVNARDAMPRGGRLTIETSNLRLATGALVRVRVHDTGVGMNEEVRAHLFEPFYTTKDVGKGTGLGLATAYGIVQQSGGNITVTSVVGQGSTFIVDLPLVRGEPLPVEPLPVFIPRGGSETILLVEDEESVRSLTRRVLELQGYLVLTAASGEEALELSARYEGRIHLLLTDVVMPGISGPRLAELLLDFRRGLRLIYMSGYAATMLERGIQLSADTAFLQKPFTTEQLMRRVREVVDVEVTTEA